MNVLNFILALLLTYWLDVLVVLVLVAIAVYLVRKGRADLVKRIVFDLVVKAEKILGSGTGPLKYNLVVASVYKYLPWLLRTVFTKQDINDFIEEAVDRLKIMLLKGDVNLLSYHEEAEFEIITQLDQYEE